MTSLLSLALLVACGGGNAASPLAPETPPSGATVTVTLFYDENGNGALDASELVRVPDATIEVGGRSGRTEKHGGRATITGVPLGTQTVSVRADSLPPFFRAGAPLTVAVPTAGEVYLPVTLPIGANRPNVYLAFGDSITDGDGSSDEQGYRGRLEALLADHFGAAKLENDGVAGTLSTQGQRRIRTSLPSFRPAYTLILYGTNDWNSSECNSTIETCYTLPALTRIVQQVKAAESLPVLATITPANTGFDDRAPADRNIRITQMNDQLKAMARAEGALLVDLYDAFMASPDFHKLFTDHVHPNDAGYELIARTFFAALSQPSAGARALPAAAQAPRLLEPLSAPRTPRARDGARAARP